MQPTDAHLRRAYADVCRPDWPALETALTDPIRGGLIRARAAALAHGAQGPPPQRRPSALAHTAAPPLRPPQPDAKRAAAGDIDDDPDDDDLTQEPTP